MMDLQTVLGIHQLRGSICPCIDTFSAIVNINGHKPTNDNGILVDCQIKAVVDEDLWPSLIHNSGILHCQHEMTQNIKVAVTTLVWGDMLSGLDEVLLYNAKNRPWAFEPYVDMKGRNSHFLMVHPRTDLQSGHDIRCIELCTGAFSGWSHAIGKIRENGYHIDHAWGLDMDPFCCRYVAKTHGFCHVSDDRNLNDSQHEMHPCVYQADIREGWFLSHASAKQAQLGLMSPPCQPWTNAVQGAKGLNRKDGMTMVWCWARMKLFQPHVVNMEMVSNITQHPHWKFVKQIIDWCGYDILWNETLQLGEVIPQSRRRVLLVAVRKDLKHAVEDLTWINWPKSSNQTLRSFGCIMDDFCRYQESPTLTKELMDIYLNEQFAPHDLKGKGKSYLREGRIKTLDDAIFPCILANYTEAHHLPMPILTEKGLFGGLLLHEAVIRFLTSPEIFILMGGVVNQWLPICKEARIHLLGNCISVPHALICILNSIRLFAGFRDVTDVQMTFAKVFGERMNNTNMKVRLSDEGMFIFRNEMQYPVISPTMPITTFAKIRVMMPTESTFFWIQSGVSIIRAMRGLTGPSMPKDLYIVLHDQIRIPIQEDDTIETCGMEIRSAIPSILHIDDRKCAKSENPFVVVLSPLGPLVIERNVVECVNYVHNTIREHFPEIGVDAGNQYAFVNPVGMKKGGDEPCNDITFMTPQAVPGTLHQNFLDGIEASCEMGIITIGTTTRRMDDIVQHFHRISLDVVVKTVGWMMVMVPNPTSQQKDAKLLFVKQPGCLSATHDAMKMLIFTRLAAVFLPGYDFSVENTIQMRIKLWDFLIWSGVTVDRKLEDFLQACVKAGDFIGCQIPLNMIIKGRQANRDFSLKEYLRNEDDMTSDNLDEQELIRLHLVTQLHGGGQKLMI